MHVSQIQDDKIKTKIDKISKLFGNSKDAVEFKDAYIRLLSNPKRFQRKEITSSKWISLICS